MNYINFNFYLFLNKNLYIKNIIKKNFCNKKLKIINVFFNNKSNLKKKK